jgi:hypothetical protein
MRRRAGLLGIPFLFLLGAGQASASHTGRYELSVVVDGARVAEYRLGDRIYVEAIRGRNFHLRLRNPGPERVAVAVSVDGRNVIDAKRTTAASAAKWVLGPYEVLEIPGWQVSGDTARRFYFTETSSSYAAWLGDTRNVGTIEAVFFRERRPTPPYVTEHRKLETPGAESRDDQAERAQEPVEGGVEGGVPGGVPAPPSSPQPVIAEEGGSKDSARESRPREGAKRRMPSSESDRYAATGAGERTDFPVQWVQFDEDPRPAASIRLRYEFRPELIRLGVLLPREDFYGRERGRGFDREYAPDPGDRR